MSWARFEADAPDLARVVRELLRRDGIDQAFLATVRGDEAPRIHPVYVGIVDGHLYTFASGVKRRDLEADGRYALHPHQDEAVPNEAAVRGHARVVDDAAERDTVAATWSFTPGAEFGLFELEIESALIGRRDSADEWPPRYTSWHVPA